MAIPVITSLAPISGPAAGGTIVTLTGTGFTGALAVGFGPSNASALSVISDTTMVAVSPAGTGTVNVTVITPAGISAVNAAVQFGYSGAAASTGAPSYYVDPALTSQIVGTLLNFLQSSTTPQAVEAQNLLMQRLALEGDVVGSRLPPPKNITEMGGYLNLLGTLGEATMREEMLAGTLGVAGPTPSLAELSATPLSMVSIANDRPAGTAQATLPLSILVRSDFLPAFQNVVTALHAQGATLPCSGPSALALPAGGPGTALPADPLMYLGRVLNLAGSAALVDPTTDSLALVSAAASGDPFAIAANVLSAGTVAVASASYDALKVNAGAVVTEPGLTLTCVLLAPALANAGFYPASPLPQPASPTDSTWTRLTNITGLVSGTTVLGDELALLYPPDAIAASAFASMVGYTWNGTAFAA
jgi:IPT/TIG domain